MEHRSMEYYIELGLRREEGLLSAREESELKDWIEASPDHKSALKEALHALDKHSFDLPFKIDTDTALTEFKRELTQREKGTPAVRRLNKTPLAIAAGIAIICGIWGVLAILQSSPKHLYHAADKDSTHHLPDGSIVNLAMGSTLEYQTTADGVRRSSLEGIGFFTVTPGTEPFIVETPHASITVVGTAFEIRSSSDSTLVRVTEGQVRVANAQNQALLAIGEMIRAHSNSLSQVKPIRQSVASWRTSKIEFDGTPLSAAIEEIRKFYPVDLQVAGEDLLLCELTGSMGLTSTDEMIRTLEIMLDVQINNEGGQTYRIEGQGCSGQ
ncbi:MAG: FecR domain-containing protein [Saprospiraceae bacterium]|nr:FecR domain-containing protein [Saprospiraceae bacterium]